jgi:hypothetical protein
LDTSDLSQTTYELRPNRKYQRQPAPALGIVHVFKVGRNGGRRLIGPSFLEDVSPGGLAIQMDEPIMIGETLCLRNRSLSYAGEVCHCSPRNGGFKIGLKLLPNQPQALSQSEGI